MKKNAILCLFFWIACTTQTSHLCTTLSVCENIENLSSPLKGDSSCSFLKSLGTFFCIVGVYTSRVVFAKNDATLQRPIIAEPLYVDSSYDNNGGGSYENSIRKRLLLQGDGFIVGLKPRNGTDYTFAKISQAIELKNGGWVVSAECEKNNSIDTYPCVTLYDQNLIEVWESVVGVPGGFNTLEFVAEIPTGIKNIVITGGYTNVSTGLYIGAYVICLSRGDGSIVWRKIDQAFGMLKFRVKYLLTTDEGEGGMIYLVGNSGGSIIAWQKYNATNGDNIEGQYHVAGNVARGGFYNPPQATKQLIMGNDGKYCFMFFVNRKNGTIIQSANYIRINTKDPSNRMQCYRAVVFDGGLLVLARFGSGIYNDTLLFTIDFNLTTIGWSRSYSGSGNPPLFLMESRGRTTLATVEDDGRLYYHIFDATVSYNNISSSIIYGYPNDTNLVLQEVALSANGNASIVTLRPKILPGEWQLAFFNYLQLEVPLCSTGLADFSVQVSTTTTLGGKVPLEVSKNSRAGFSFSRGQNYSLVSQLATSFGSSLERICLPPSLSPTSSPTDFPTISSISPTFFPTGTSLPPTVSSIFPTSSPTNSPTDFSLPPTDFPTNSPSDITTSPTGFPTTRSKFPTGISLPPTVPSIPPTRIPTLPSFSPTRIPTDAPTFPSFSPTDSPTATPTESPSASPTTAPTSTPSQDNSITLEEVFIAILVPPAILGCIALIVYLLYKYGPEPERAR